MKAILGEKAIKQIERLCNELPIRCSDYAQEILNVVATNIEKPKEQKKNDATTSTN